MRYAIREVGIKGVSTGRNTACGAAVAVSAAQIPPSGPRPGSASATTGPYFSSPVPAPARQVLSPAPCKISRACATSGLPPNAIRLLSLPIRLDRPPARTNPAGGPSALSPGLNAQTPPETAQSTQSPTRSSSSGTSRSEHEYCRPANRSPSSRSELPGDGQNPPQSESSRPSG